MIVSPYKDQPAQDWLAITHRLVNKYPIDSDELLEIATLAWHRLWSSNIGGGISMVEANFSAQIIGSFFQTLFSQELAKRYPESWRGEIYKSDKDLVNLDDTYFSTEMKLSGQKRYEIFGNRSFNQETMDSGISGKNKSGYYITLNYYKQSMTRLRIGWIDQSDWKSQSAASGQSATLDRNIYDSKLVTIEGSYILKTPIELLDGVGPSFLGLLHSVGVYTFNDLKNYNGSDPRTKKLQEREKLYLQRLETLI